MTRLHIDFAPHTFNRTVARIGVITWAVIGLALAVCASLGYQSWVLWQRHLAGEVELRHLQAALVQKRARIVPPKPRVISPDQAAAVNQAIAQLNLPWRDVLNAVETATPATIAVLSLEPNARKHQLQGMAEAKSSDAMIAYVEQLKRSSFFETVMLAQHEVNEQDPNKPIRFTFEAHWKEAGL